MYWSLYRCLTTFIFMILSIVVKEIFEKSLENCLLENIKELLVPRKNTNNNFRVCTKDERASNKSTRKMTTFEDGISELGTEGQKAPIYLAKTF